MPSLQQPLNFRGTLDIKRAFVIGLREIFASNLVEERYLYKPVPDPKHLRTGDDDGGAAETKIKIYRSFPKRMNFYPSLVITTLGFNASLTAMGETKEEAAGQQDPAGIFRMTYGGHMIVPVQIKIYGKDNTFDRDKLTDTLLIMLRIMQREVFARFGIGYVTIDVGGEDQYEDTDGIMVFTNTVTLQCNTDWNLITTPSQNELFEQVLLRVYMQAQEGDPLELLAPET